MRLGLLGMSAACLGQGDLKAVFDQLRLADGLGFHLAYLPNFSPLLLANFRLSPDMRLGVGLDAAAFGALSPRNLEAAVRRVNEHLTGRLYLGVEICSESGSRVSRTEAQNFETLFSTNSIPCNTSLSGFPMTPPCPKIVGIPKTGGHEEAAHSAARGYLPLTPSWLRTEQVARHWPAIVEGATSALRPARPSHWNLARMIVVHDDPAKIEPYVSGANSMIRRYYARLAKRGLLVSNLDDHLKQVVISGSAEKITEDILALQEAVGEIGTLHMIDLPGGDPDMTRTTMVRMAEDVLPMVSQLDARQSKELERT